MKKILDQIILLPIIALYYSLGLYLAIRLNLSIDYFVYGFYIISGILIKYIRSRKTNHKKLTNTLCSLSTLLLFVILFIKPIFATLSGIYSSIINFNIYYLFESIGSVFNRQLYVPSFYYFAFIIIRCIYQDVIVEKKTSFFSGFALFVCLVGWLVSKKLYTVNLVIIALSLLLRVFRSSYNNINSIGIIKTSIICLLFICCTIASYFLFPYVENVSVKSTVDGIMEKVSDVANELFNGNEQTLDSDSSNIFMINDEVGLSEDIIMTINSSFKIDRVKAYTCAKYDINKNAFVLDKKIIKDKDTDFTDLFINHTNTKLPEYMHITVNKQKDNVAYIPYGDLSFTQDAYLYDDQVVQFENKEDYKDYYLTFNPNNYQNELKDSKEEQSKYHEYALKKYTKESEKTLPDKIKKAITSFISENEGYEDISFIDEELHALMIQDGEEVYKEREKVERINNYINNNFVIKPTYTKNDEGIDDVSYALLHKHEANLELIAAIKTFMYRYEGIPSRFVVGYYINEYEGNNAYVREKDLTYWSEVFINGQWVPSDDLYLPVGDGTKTETITTQSDNSLGSMDGELKDTFDEFSSNDIKDDNTIALTIETNYEVDRIKQSSFGDYNPSKQTFEYEEDISNYNSIIKISRVNDLNQYFKNLFIVNGNYKYYMKITSNVDSNNVYVPYGTIDIQNVSMYQDKAILFDENLSSYVVNFEPYNNTNKFKSSSFYDDYVYEKYLSVPDSMINELQDYLISNGIDYKSNDKSLLIRQIKNLLQGGDYKYTLEPGEVPEGRDLLLYFLIDNKQGFCQHFAGAATLLYRVCGIPARYTVGFAIDNYENGIAYAMINDAHAWTEVYTKNYGWKPIEVTASSALNNIDLSEIEIDYTNEDLNLNDSESNAGSNNQFNVQPDFTLESQIQIGDDFTIINNELKEEDKDEVIASITTDSKLIRVKAYSLGNYNVDNQTFYLGEDINSQKDISKISKIYDINNFFINLFTKKENQEHEINVKVYDDEKWVYVPYGKLNIDQANMYQDKYFYFDDETKYDDYSLTYSETEPNNEFDEKHDYENFVYDYYTEIPYDYKAVLLDFLNEKNIDVTSSDKLSIIKNIQELLSTKYIYVNNANNDTNETDKTLDFIIRSRKGDANLFANGATMLFRMCGIPARRVDGLYLADYDNNTYELKNNDKHSWVEVYTSNYGWAPVEVCPDYYCENIDEYKFNRIINEEDDVEFIDIEGKRETKKWATIIGVSGIVLIIVLSALIIKKKNDEYKAKLKAMGIDNAEQLRLLRDINSNYLLLKQNGYVNAEVKYIMLRIRFSTRKETQDDLDVILKQVEYMKQDKKNRKKKNKKKKDMV